MTSEEKEKLIEEAKIRYPIGTKIVSMGGTINACVDNHKLYWNDDYLRCNGKCALYHDKPGRGWADITQYTKSVVINNYSIY